MPHLLLDHYGLGRQSKIVTHLLFLKKPLPLKDVTRVQAGIFHSFTFPDQLPVARYWLFGENRTWAIGRSSPIWEPRLAYVYKKGNMLFIIKKKVQSCIL